MTGCICGGVNYVDFILLHVIRYNGTTQKPHDHLFQKSEQLGLQILPKIASKSQKANFRCDSVTGCIYGGVNYVDFILLHVIHCNGTTQKPHEHLLQKSGQLVLQI